MSNKCLEKAKLQVLFNKEAGLLGSLMCQLNFVEDTSLKYVSVINGTDIKYNPDLFNSLEPVGQKTVLYKALWSTALLHNIRGKDKDKKTWEKACDIYIESILDTENYNASYEYDLKHSKDELKKYRGLAEEEIYKKLLNGNTPPNNSNNPNQQNNSSGSGSSNNNNENNDENQENNQPSVGIDSTGLSKTEEQAQIDKVSKAQAAGKLAGTGSCKEVEKLLQKFLKPKIDWKQALSQFLTDACEYNGTTWSRPNRRFQDMYLPSKVMEEGKLTHLMYFLDVSGSIDDKDIKRFNSELAYIKEELKPSKLTVLYFDTEILDKVVYEEDDDFIPKKAPYGGGTSYKKVYDEIIKNKPTCAVIFTDLYCDPMPKVDIPVLWVCNNEEKHEILTGKRINIHE